MEDNLKYCEMEKKYSGRKYNFKKGRNSSVINNYINKSKIKMNFIQKSMLNN